MVNVYKPASDLTREDILEVVDYDPASGTFTWKDTPNGKMNRRFVGKPALDNIDKDGYRFGVIRSCAAKAHRVVWLVHYGEWPSDEIDHINGNRSDNRVENLRNVSRRENMRNAGVASNNTSGRTGVSWQARRSKWMAYIKVNQKMKNLGEYVRFEDAVIAREKAEREAGFVSNGRRGSYVLDRV